MDGNTWKADAHEIEDGRGELLARSEITVHCEVVPPFNVIPRKALEKTCSGKTSCSPLPHVLTPVHVQATRVSIGTACACAHMPISTHKTHMKAYRRKCPWPGVC